MSESDIDASFRETMIHFAANDHRLKNFIRHQYTDEINTAHSFGDDEVSTSPMERILIEIARFYTLDSIGALAAYDLCELTIEHEMSHGKA